VFSFSSCIPDLELNEAANNQEHQWALAKTKQNSQQNVLSLAKG
jgi:hypothetical protein